MEFPSNQHESFVFLFCEINSINKIMFLEIIAVTVTFLHTHTHKDRDVLQQN